MMMSARQAPLANASFHLACPASSARQRPPPPRKGTLDRPSMLSSQAHTCSYNRRTISSSPSSRRGVADQHVSWRRNVACHSVEQPASRTAEASGDAEEVATDSTHGAPNPAGGRRTFLATSTCGLLVPGLMAFPEDASARFPFREEAVREVEPVRQMDGNLGVSAAPLLRLGQQRQIRVYMFTYMYIKGPLKVTPMVTIMVMTVGSR